MAIFILATWSVAAGLIYLGVRKLGGGETAAPGEMVPITSIPGVYFAAAALFLIAGVLFGFFVIGAEAKGGKKKKSRRR
jgi:hypothetical protein